MSIFRDRIEFSRGIRILYQVREQATPSTSRGIIPTALAKAFCGQKPTPTLPSFIFSNRFIIEAVMIYRPDSGKRLSRQNLAKFALCRKILRRKDNYPPDNLNATLGQNSPIMSEDLQGGFPMKNWCSFDAMTVRKRTISSLLSDLLSPISEPWNDVFHANKSPQTPCFPASTDFLTAWNRLVPRSDFGDNKSLKSL